MLALLEAFFQIAMRRRGPEDLPDSALLLHITLLAYMLAQVPVAAEFYGGPKNSLLAILADTALLAVCFWLPLKFTRRTHRYRRTMIALLGTGALLSLVQTPLVFLSGLVGTTGQPPVVATLGYLLLLIWSIVVQAHIAARALSSPLWVGLGIALIYFAVSSRITAQFAPAAS